MTNSNGALETRPCIDGNSNLSFTEGAFAMMSKSLEAAEQQYIDLMVETRTRLVAIETAIKKQIGLPAIGVRDFGYIELRMLCELIALACLVAHGHLPGAKTKKLRDQWRAQEIIDALDVLHPDFFPRAATQKRLGPDSWDFRVLDSKDAMSKADLKKLCALCGDRLHRGDLTQLNRFTPKSLGSDFKEITSWTNELKKLLGLHAISLLDGKTRYFCTLWTVPSGHVAFLRAVKREPDGHA